jgi:hypothetical protein
MQQYHMNGPCGRHQYCHWASLCHRYRHPKERWFRISYSYHLPTSSVIAVTSTSFPYWPSQKSDDQVGRTCHDQQQLVVDQSQLDFCHVNMTLVDHSVSWGISLQCQLRHRYCSVGRALWYIDWNPGGGSVGHRKTWIRALLVALDRCEGKVIG